MYALLSAGVIPKPISLSHSTEQTLNVNALDFPVSLGEGGVPFRLVLEGGTMDKADVTPAKGAHKEKNQRNVFSLQGKKNCLNKTGLKAHTE